MAAGRSGTARVCTDPEPEQRDDRRLFGLAHSPAGCGSLIPRCGRSKLAALLSGMALAGCPHA